MGPYPLLRDLSPPSTPAPAPAPPPWGPECVPRGVALALHRPQGASRPLARRPPVFRHRPPVPPAPSPFFPRLFPRHLLGWRPDSCECTQLPCGVTCPPRPSAACRQLRSPPQLPAWFIFLAADVSEFCVLPFAVSSVSTLFSSLFISLPGLIQMYFENSGI